MAVGVGVTVGVRVGVPVGVGVLVGVPVGVGVFVMGGALKSVTRTPSGSIMVTPTPHALPLSPYRILI